MNRTTKLTVTTFGVLAAVAGLEHGIGEILQGNVAPESTFILSWGDSELFRVLAGEPAMTLVPNLLITGILAVLVSLIFLAWVTIYVHRRHGGPVLILISLVWLLVGGGFGPPLLGVILGLTATRINSPLGWWRNYVPAGARRLLGGLWSCSYVAGVVAWLFLFPGTILLDYFVGIGDPDLVVSLTVLSAFSTLFTTIFTALARDAVARTEPGRASAPAV